VSIFSEDGLERVHGAPADLDWDRVFDALASGRQIKDKAARFVMLYLRMQCGKSWAEIADITGILADCIEQEVGRLTDILTDQEARRIREKAKGRVSRQVKRTLDCLLPPSQQEE